MEDNSGGNAQTSQISSFEKIKRQDVLSAVFMSVVFVGSLGVGVCILLSEILFSQIHAFLVCPVWYQTFMFVSLAVAVAGIVGCGFTKNSQNTSNLECRIEFSLFLVGAIIELICSLISPESYLSNLFFCLGGAIVTGVVFCGIASFIGNLKKSPKDLAFAKVYYDLIVKGPLGNQSFPKTNPSTLSEIEEVEKYFGTPLPAELADFLREFNGDGKLLYSARKIIETTQSIRKNFKGKANEAQKLCLFGGAGAGDYFADTYFCYRICDDGSFEGREIYLWDSRANETKLVATSLKDLIAKYYKGEMIWGDEFFLKSNKPQA